MDGLKKCVGWTGNCVAVGGEAPGFRSPHGDMSELIPIDALEEAFKRVPRWRPSGTDRSRMERCWGFRGFREAVEFVCRVAELAERENHHPDIDIRFRRVRLVLTTHDAGGLTGRDFDFAERVDALGDAG
jgi:4a-hydroxytetrahydrobiopterin dehydratase